MYPSYWLDAWLYNSVDSVTEFTVDRVLQFTAHCMVDCIFEFTVDSMLQSIIKLTVDSMDDFTDDTEFILHYSW